MKTLIVLVLIMALCSSVALAEAGKAKDPVTATCEVAAKTVEVPVKAVFGPREAKPVQAEEAKPQAAKK